MPKDPEPVLVPLECIGTMGKLQQLRRRGAGAKMKLAPL